MNKQTPKKLAKIFCFTDLLITELDSANLTEEAKDLKQKATDFLAVLEKTNEKFYTGGGGKTTFFLELKEKINYVFDKVYR